MFFFSSRRRHTRYWRDWSSDVCSSDLHHPLHARAVVPTAVEEHDFTGCGQMGKVALDVHLRLLPLGRGWQSHRPEDARTRSFGDELDHASLASGITPLEEHAHLRPTRPHPFLEFDQ